MCKGENKKTPGRLALPGSSEQSWNDGQPGHLVRNETYEHQSCGQVLWVRMVCGVCTGRAPDMDSWSNGAPRRLQALWCSSVRGIQGPPEGMSMESRWSDVEAAAQIERYADWGEDLALRVYTSHLIGAEESLVLHGGGNTSVKSIHTNLFGESIEALYVKGSGWNLGDIEPQGFPGLDLNYLLRVVALPELSDEQMVNEQRTHMFDATAPNPSIETLLHAALPAKFVDHSHADAILALTNHPEGERYVREALGDDVLLIPYVKPGFDLARLAAAMFKEHPDCSAMVLMQHGLFTWGATARESYERHIDMVTRAEAYVAKHATDPCTDATADEVSAAVELAGRIGPLLRGALGADGQRWILRHDVDAELLGQVNDERIERWVAAGPLTPDHVIRTKNLACLVPPPADVDSLSAWSQACHEAVAAYRRSYIAYFEACAEGGTYTRLDTTPRVVVVPGVGIFGVGDSSKAARICTDITRHTLSVKEMAEGLGPFEGLDDPLLFEIEYWSLEQAKLGRKKAAALSRQVALVTGAAGAIGLGVARRLLDAGAHVVLADVSMEGLQRAEQLLAAPGRVATVRMDVTDEASVAWGFQAAAQSFGGVDIVVPNAGVALSGPITELGAGEFAQVMQVNAHGVFLTVREAGRLLKSQGTGGHIVLVSSKNVFGPGAEFAAYSASKAAAHQLCKVAALEYAPHGISVNMVNPDAVFSQDGVSSGLWDAIGPDRARAKGIEAGDLQEHYRKRNLLGQVITGDHVGNAVVFFVTDQTPTTGATIPVDGGVATAFPR